MRKVEELPLKRSAETTRTKVAAYARVSTGKDAMLHSLSAQVSYYSRLIQQRADWEYVGVYADEGISGTKENRKNFQKMLEDARLDKIDLILTKSISRFARNTLLLLETVRELKDLGIAVYFGAGEDQQPDSGRRTDALAPCFLCSGRVSFRQRKQPLEHQETF